MAIAHRGGLYGFQTITPERGAARPSGQIWRTTDNHDYYVYVGSDGIVRAARADAAEVPGFDWNFAVTSNNPGLVHQATRRFTNADIVGSWDDTLRFFEIAPGIPDCVLIPIIATQIEFIATQWNAVSTVTLDIRWESNPTLQLITNDFAFSNTTHTPRIIIRYPNESGQNLASTIAQPVGEALSLAVEFDQAVANGAAENYQEFSVAYLAWNTVTGEFEPNS